jgi:hypothetical protein
MRTVGSEGGLTLTVNTGPTQQSLLRLAVWGYAGGLGSSAVLNRCSGTFKQCVYLLREHGVAAEQWAHEAQSEAYIEDRSTGDRTGVFLSHELARRIGGLTQVTPGRAGGLLGTTPAAAPPPPFDLDRTRAAAAEVNRFLSQADSPGFQRVTAAIEWLFDSETAADQTMGYLAACIGIESILGDDEKGELHTTRLADRYAYMLGRDRTERGKLAKTFLQAFSVRGTLVHARQPRLSRDDQAHLHSIRAILRDLLGHEIAVMAE